jgi:hypothetical protein
MDYFKKRRLALSTTLKTEYKGATHKDAKGKVMSGKTHTASSKYLFHKKDLPTSATKKA